MVAAEGLRTIGGAGQGLAEQIDVLVDRGVGHGRVLGQDIGAHGPADVVFLLGGDVLEGFGHRRAYLDQGVRPGNDVRGGEGREVATGRRAQGQRQQQEQWQSSVHCAPPGAFSPPWLRKACICEAEIRMASIRSIQTKLMPGFWLRYWLSTA